MDTDSLQTFVVAAAEENFHRTAEKLHLAQPTVSTQIAKLEQELGIRLFERAGRGVRLSEPGRRFLVRAQSALEELREGARELTRLAQGYDQTLTLAASPLVATTYLPRWIQGFLREWPSTEVSVEVTDSQGIEGAVGSGECDLGFSRIPADSSRIDTLRLYDDPVVAAASPGRHDLDGPVRTLDELVDHYPLLIHNHPLYWDELVPFLRLRYPVLRTMRVSQVDVTLRWVEEDMGFSFLPRSTVRRSLLLGTAIEVPTPGFELPVAHTYLLKDSVTLSPAARRFGGFVQAYMDERSV